MKEKLESLKSRKKGVKTIKKQKSKQQKDTIAPEYLVGKLVDHIFDSEEDADLQVIHTGRITRIVKRAKNPRNTIFEIVYEADYADGDSDDEDREPDEEVTYEYALLQDYYQGNLVIKT